MKALSVRHPWAWAILHAGKNIENRSRPLRYRGPILIHASKGMTRGEYEEFEWFYQDVRAPEPLPPLPYMHHLEGGGIIGRVEIIDCVSEHSSPWFWGPFGFVLANPEPLPFRPYRGQLGLFEVQL